MAQGRGDPGEARGGLLSGAVLDLSGRVAFVTGSTRGIGWAAARALADAGASVVINGRSGEDAERRAAELAAELGIETLAVACDAGHSDEVEAAYQAVFRRFRRLDILVNNAGVLADALLGMISPADVERIVATNLFGSIYHLQAASRLMRRGRSGSIVNMASIVGVTGNAGQAVYSSSKAAVVGLTRSAAKELAPLGIRVNAVAPGFIDTDMTRALPEAVFEERAASVKMGRVGRPEDVAGTILYLASDLSAYVTGQVIGVDGGMVI